MPDTAISRAIAHLEGHFGAGKVTTSGPSYEQARKVWNGAVEKRPAAFVLCKNERDVQAAVVILCKYDVLLSVRGGGHDWAGRALQGQVVLDLTGMSDVSVEGTVASVGGGITSRALSEALAPLGLAAVTGQCGDVGVAALTLGGGYGNLTARHGLAVDNLLSADIVLADGRILTVDETAHPDLFWAIRGGGGNFGVVTRLRLRVHPLPSLYTGIVVFPWAQARDVFSAFEAQMDSLPDELMLAPAFVPTPDGGHGVAIQLAWCGAPEADARMLAQVVAFGKPLMSQATRKGLPEVFDEFDATITEGMHWTVRTVTLAGFEPEALGLIERAMDSRPSPGTSMATHPCYGAAERVGASQTAFGIRQRHFVLGIYAGSEPSGAQARNAWADALEADLAPFALNTAYANYLGTDRPTQAARAFGPNASRLRELKNRYDPDGVFTAIALP